MWVGRHGKVGELALEGTAKLFEYRDGPCPAERHWQVLSYVGAGQGYWRLAGGGATGWIYRHDQRTQIGGRRKLDVGSVHGSLYSVGRITLSSDDEPLGPQKVGSSLTISSP